MKMKMKVFVFAVISVIVLLTSGCANTFSAMGGLMKGVGEDMQTMSEPYLENSRSRAYSRR